MKKTILLLSFFSIANFTFSQEIPIQKAYAIEWSASQKTAEKVYTKFEDVVFTQSNKKGIIISYLQLGGIQKGLGHFEEASSFFERAYVLAKDHYRSLPNEENVLSQVEKNYQSILKRFTLSDFSKEKNTKADEDFANNRLEVIPYLQKAAEQNHLVNNSGTTMDLTEQKIVASYFTAITEPVGYDVFTIEKTTSLRKSATHKSRSLQRLATGTKVKVIERTNKYWWKVGLEETSGYVKALLLKSDS